ncbi:MAG: T9SS type A sorting domain-containing protein [Prolixibacteraceae bacterium]|nr:T9SS type A sorting domain-containing protein [Prolixibacteraceae bacterium]MBT6997032.1 T9SS type A sorting domain-containing protein [Prolixibacteraceae bacterium]MBT7396913.1 T9SS type A sorting domain-containing protein [Prolixibacteraceae bacterium]
MKQIILIITGILLASGVIAQPTITQLMNLDIGDKYTVKEGGVGITSAMISVGANQNWDFSNLPEDDDPAVVICVDPTTTPFADSTEVKNSNLAIKPFGRDADTIQIYQYMKVSNDRSESMAMGMYDQIQNTNVSYTKWLDPLINLKVPFTYGDTYSDRHILWINHIIENTYILKDTSNTEITAVGYGTLKTPAATFQNALLVKATVNWSWWNNYADHQYKTEGTDVSYQWFVPGIKVAVMSVNLVDENGGFVSYISGTEFNKGGINNPDDGDGGDGGDGDDDPYDPSGVWLNTMSGGGEFFSQNNGSLNWTLGESIIETMEVNPTLTQGFIQPADIAVAVKELEIESKIKVYPNPFISDLTIDFPSFKHPVDAAIYSTTGQVMKTFSVEGPITHLQLNDYKSGIYYIRMMAEEGPRSFVVVKK